MARCLSANAQGAPALPYSPSLDLTSLDKSVDPCVDLYQYSCGGWEKKNPIPGDQTRWDVYGKLYQDNLDLLRRILEDAATAPKRDSLTRQIGDFYAACMDEAAGSPYLRGFQSALEGWHGLRCWSPWPFINTISEFSYFGRSS